MHQQDIVVKLFDYFYMKVHRNPNFHLDLSMRNHQKCIDNFFKRLSQHYQLQALGENFFIDYFCFQWNYWINKKIKRNISLEWIIGPKALDRWYEREEFYQYHYQEQLLKTHKISLGVLRDLLKQKNDVYEDVLSEAEELEKIRFDGPARLFNCMSHTTLYTIKSSHCRMCKQSKDCRELLKSTNRKLYNKRGLK